MHFRPAIVILFVAVGCQDKKPAGPPATTEIPATAGTTTAAATTTSAQVPVGAEAPTLEGSIDGKPFRPNTVSLDDTPQGPVLVFHHTEAKGESSIGIVTLPVPDGQKLEGRNWTFGGKVDDPLVVLTRPGGEQPKGIAGPDYTLTLRLTKQTRDAVEGVVELTVKSPAATLKGPFRATYHRSPTAALGPDDAPYIHGKIMLKSAKKTEKLAAGYVGVGADGKPYSNEASFPVNIGEAGYAPVPNAEKPSQVSWLVSTESAITYRHLNVPPGDYLVYVRRDTVMSAWKRVKIKDGDRQTVDFTIDPANTGEVVATLPASDSKEMSLALVPAKADLPELGLGSEHYFNVATLKLGEKTVKLSGIPAGKYRAVRGGDEAEVEVVAGKSVAVTLAPKK